MSSQKPKLDLDAVQSEQLSDLSAYFQQTTSTQVDKRTSGQVGKSVKPQVDKYTTHLRPATIEEVRSYAFHHKRKDYEIVQQALDEFFARQREAEQQKTTAPGLP